MKKQYHQQFEVIDRKALRQVNGSGLLQAATVCRIRCGGGLECPSDGVIICVCGGSHCMAI